MTKDELKLAFQKAFQMGQDYWYYANHEFESYNKKSDAIRAKFNEMVKETIEEALAQPEQEPVAWEQFYPDIGKPQIAINSETVGYVAPQRTWVGLTEEEIEKGRAHTFSINNPYCPCDSKTMRKAVRWAEAKLKKKNTRGQE